MYFGKIDLAGNLTLYGAFGPIPAIGAATYYYLFNVPAPNVLGMAATLSSWTDPQIQAQVTGWPIDYYAAATVANGQQLSQPGRIFHPVDLKGPTGNVYAGQTISISAVTDKTSNWDVHTTDARLNPQDLGGVVTYHWSTLGNSGRFWDSGGHSGLTLDTATDSVQFVPDTALAASVKETLQVRVSFASSVAPRLGDVTVAQANKILDLEPLKITGTQAVSSSYYLNDAVHNGVFMTLSALMPNATGSVFFGTDPLHPEGFTELPVVSWSPNPDSSSPNFPEGSIICQYPGLKTGGYLQLRSNGAVSRLRAISLWHATADATFANAGLPTYYAHWVLDGIGDVLSGWKNVGFPTPFGSCQAHSSTGATDTVCDGIIVYTEWSCWQGSTPVMGSPCFFNHKFNSSEPDYSPLLSPPYTMAAQTLAVNGIPSWSTQFSAFTVEYPPIGN